MSGLWFRSSEYFEMGDLREPGSLFSDWTNKSFQNLRDCCLVVVVVRTERAANRSERTRLVQRVLHYHHQPKTNRWKDTPARKENAIVIEYVVPPGVPKHLDLDVSEIFLYYLFRNVHFLMEFWLTLSIFCWYSIGKTIIKIF